MSRSIVRSLVVGLALVAAPAVAQAQTCSDTSTVGGATCAVNATASMVVPQIVNLSIPSATIDLTVPNWNTFLSGAATQFTQTLVVVTTNANTTYDVSLHSAAGWNTARTLSDLTYTLAATCATAGTDIPNALSTIYSGTAGSTNTNLCLTTRFVTDLSDPIMAAGTHNITLTLTITAP